MQMLRHSVRPTRCDKLLKLLARVHQISELVVEVLHSGRLELDPAGGERIAEQ